MFEPNINNKEIQHFIQTFLNTSHSNNENMSGLQEKFNAILDDFKQYYIFSHKNPEYEEYIINYERVKTQLQTMMNLLTQQEHNLQQKKGEFNKFSVLLQNEIEKEQHINQLLTSEKKETNGSIHNDKQVYSNIKNKSNIMLYNSITIYTQQKIKNIGLVVGILFLIYLTAKI